jgi:hypothetical protein
VQSANNLCGWLCEEQKSNETVEDEGLEIELV